MRNPALVVRTFYVESMGGWWVAFDDAGEIWYSRVPFSVGEPAETE
jgi:hypothetical protein